MSEYKKLQPPTHFEPEYLYKKYEPLRKALYSRLKDKMPSAADMEDLESHINISFIELVSEYDPNRGVDFPYFIKRMLELRAWHFVTKVLKNVNNESYDEQIIDTPDIEMMDLMDKIIDLNSLDPDIVLGDKHRNLMIGVLIERKSLRELAEIEGVPADRLYARLYFLINKLRKEHDKVAEIFGEDMYG